MAQARFRFYGELTLFLPYARRNVEFGHVFDGRVSIKDMIESFSVPHTEVDVILVNGESVDFDYLVADGDSITVYPGVEAADAAVRANGLIRLRPAPPAEARFVLDVHLGKLASHLRMLGFDTLYWNEDLGDETLARISNAETRIMLTRDRGLLKRNTVTHGCYLRSTDARQQLGEVLRRFNLLDRVAPFTRCIRCNGLLHPVDKDAVADRIEPNTHQFYDEFRVCGDCQHVYWRGSHFERMAEFVEAIVNGQTL